MDKIDRAAKLANFIASKNKDWFQNSPLLRTHISINGNHVSVEVTRFSGIPGDVAIAIIEAGEISKGESIIKTTGELCVNF
jgi:hypothetical protein